jgi:hypothetical protein
MILETLRRSMDNGNRKGVGIRTIVRTADEENRNLFHLWYQKRFEEEDSKARKLEGSWDRV